MKEVLVKTMLKLGTGVGKPHIEYGIIMKMIFFLL